MYTASPLGAIDGPKVIEGRVFRDERGWFTESWRADGFRLLGLPEAFVQDNLAYNLQAGILRGLHFQRPPAAQGKLVRCLAGRAFDVAVDIRRGSPTFGRWAGVELRPDDGRQVWIPAGFAHGYCTLEPGTLMAYKVDAPYSPGHEGSVRWDDPAIGVRWPVPHPILSAKDRAAPPLGQAVLE